MARSDDRSVRLFVQTVREHYSQHGRVLPWRMTQDPYCILVSEVMLQQTQVDRVIPKYLAFLEQFPTAAHLSEATLLEVLRLWQGLGYNRRAKALWQAAQLLCREFSDSFPETTEDLMRLPGVGSYTAGAVLAFAFDRPVVFIETNIRTVFIHHFFADADLIEDREILPLIERTLDRQAPRTWYYALMDYGSFLKRTHGSSNHRSSHYRAQGRFAGSRRQVRGAVIRALTPGQAMSGTVLGETLGIDTRVLQSILEELLGEGLVEKSGSMFRIP